MGLITCGMMEAESINKYKLILSSMTIHEGREKVTQRQSPQHQFEAKTTTRAVYIFNVIA